MDSSEAAEDIIDQDDGKVSGDEAMDSITNWKVSFFFNPVSEAQKNSDFFQPRIESLQNPFIR